MAIFLAALLTAAAPRPAPSPPPDDAAYLACLAAHDDDLRGQRDCIADEYLRLETSRVAVAEMALSAPAGARGRARLRREERLWRARRERDCAAAEAQSIVLANLELQQCLLDATRTRLETYRR